MKKTLIAFGVFYLFLSCVYAQNIGIGTVTRTTKLTTQTSINSFFTIMNSKPILIRINNIKALQSNNPIV